MVLFFCVCACVFFFFFSLKLCNYPYTQTHIHTHTARCHSFTPAKETFVCLNVPVWATRAQACLCACTYPGLCKWAGETLVDLQKEKIFGKCTYIFLFFVFFLIEKGVFLAWFSFVQRHVVVFYVVVFVCTWKMICVNEKMNYLHFYVN